MKLEGTTALVTGASRGLGEALAEELGRQGARLVLVARNPEKLEQVASRIRARGGEAHALAGNVGKKDDIHRIAGAAAALVGPIDLLVQNASTLGPLPLPLLLDTECEDLERTLAVNLVGPFRLAKALVGSMVLRGRGLVLHLSSDAAVSAYPRWGGYSASKVALDHLARIWAEELKDTGVQFLAVDPGDMDTQMHAEALPDADRSTLARPGEVAKRLVSMIRASERLESGSRLEAAKWEVA